MALFPFLFCFSPGVSPYAMGGFGIPGVKEDMKQLLAWRQERTRLAQRGAGEYRQRQDGHRQRQDEIRRPAPPPPHNHTQQRVLTHQPPQQPLAPSPPPARSFSPAPDHSADDSDTAAVAVAEPHPESGRKMSKSSEQKTEEQELKTHEEVEQGMDFLQSELAS